LLPNVFLGTEPASLDRESFHPLQPFDPVAGPDGNIERGRYRMSMVDVMADRHGQLVGLALEATLSLPISLRDGCLQSASRRGR